MFSLNLSDLCPNSSAVEHQTYILGVGGSIPSSGIVRFSLLGEAKATCYITGINKRQMPNNHGLRTTGTHTGNFGRARVKGKPGELDLTKEILSKENLRIPKPDVAFTRLVEAYNITTCPKLRAGLWEMLKRRKATLQTPITNSITRN